MEDMNGNFIILGGKVVNGKLVSAEKIIPIDRIENGMPVIKALKTTETHHPDGKIDCKIEVPCFSTLKE
jgi:hypothetical protein